MITAADMTEKGTGTCWRGGGAASDRLRSAATLPMPSTYFELAIREFGGSAETEVALRANTGITADEPGGEITLGQQLQQVRNINRLQSPGWGLRLGRRFEAATHGPLGFAAMSAPTLATAVAVIERYGHVRAPYFRFLSRGDARRFILEIHEHVPLSGEERVPLMETLMASLQGLLEGLVGSPLPDASFHFAWPSPTYVERYADAFHGAVRFDAPRVMLAFPLPSLWLRCATADPVMYDVSVGKLEMLQRRLEGDDHLVGRIEHVIAVRTQCPTLQEMADLVHMSTRTVIRHLRRAGTTYQELTDAHRRQQAEMLLANPSLDVAEIAYGLGYADPANFGRACRRWFGVAPSYYRERMHEAEWSVSSTSDVERTIIANHPRAPQSSAPRRNGGDRTGGQPGRPPRTVPRGRGRRSR